MVICKYNAAGKKYVYAHDGPCKYDTSLTAVKPDTHLATSTDRCSSLTCTSTDTYLICGSDGVTYRMLFNIDWIYFFCVHVFLTCSLLNVLYGGFFLEA